MKRKMIYGEKCVLPLIQCKLCKSTPEIVKILLCGHYCEDCVTELTKDANNDTREFTCNSCLEIHTIPKNGFNSWNALNDFYSQETDFEEINKGEKAEQLNKNLIDIRILIDDSNSILDKIVDSVKDDCLKIKNQISLAAELVIKQIHDVKDALLEEVNVYERKCVSNAKSHKTQKNNFDDYIDELNNYHKKWTEYLKNSQINDNDILEANKSASELQKRFKNVKIGLRNFISNYKEIFFRSDQFKFEKSSLGFIDFNEDDGINFARFQRFFFSGILKDLNNSFVYSPDFDFLDNGNIVAAFPCNSSGNVKVAIIDKSFTVCNMVEQQFNFNRYYNLKLKALKNSFVYYLYEDIKHEHILVLIDSDLQLIRYIRTPHQVYSLGVDESTICCYLNVSTDIIMILDHQLNVIKKIGQFEDPKKEFYFKDKLTQVLYKANKFYCLRSGMVDIIDEKTGALLYSIKIEGNQMAFDSKLNLIVFSLHSRKICKFNLDGIFLDESILKDASFGVEFLIDKSDRLFFYNKTFHAFYLD